MIGSITVMQCASKFIKLFQFVPDFMATKGMKMINEKRVWPFIFDAN